MEKSSAIQRIEVEINNGRTMQLAQQMYDGTIAFTTYNTESGLVDREGSISPGDMVMLMNYYHHQLKNGLPIF